MDRRFVCGQDRRHLKVIGTLGTLDTLLGARVTTRSWSTILKVATALAGAPADPQVSLRT